MKNKWLNDAEIPDKYIVTNEELLEERAESYNIFKEELLNIFPDLPEEKIKEIYNEKFGNI